MTDNLVVLPLLPLPHAASLDTFALPGSNDVNSKLNNDFQQLFSSLLDIKTEGKKAIGIISENKQLDLNTFNSKHLDLTNLELPKLVNASIESKEKLEKPKELDSNEDVLLSDKQLPELNELNLAGFFVKEKQSIIKPEPNDEKAIGKPLESSAYLALSLNPEFHSLVSLPSEEPATSPEKNPKTQPNTSALIESYSYAFGYSPSSTFLLDESKIDSDMLKSPNLNTRPELSPAVTQSFSSDAKTQSYELLNALKGTVLKSNEASVSLPVNIKSLGETQPIISAQQVALEATFNLTLDNEAVSDSVKRDNKTLNSKMDELVETEILSLPPQFENEEFKRNTSQGTLNVSVERNITRPLAVEPFQERHSDTSKDKEANPEELSSFIDQPTQNSFELQPLNQVSAEGLKVMDNHSAESQLPVKPIQQVLQAAIEGVTQKQSSIKMRLNPEALGQVDIQLQTTAPGEITARLLVENKEALQQLQGELHSLKEAFSKQGLTLNYAEVILKGDVMNAQDATQIFSANASHEQQGQGASFAQHQSEQHKQETLFSQSGFNSFQGQQGGQASYGQNPYTAAATVWDKQTLSGGHPYLNHPLEDISAIETNKIETQAELLGSRYLFHA